MYKTATCLLALLAFNATANERQLVLSGTIRASDNQAFYAPKTDTWRVQVQWMMPEGDVAKKGDLVVAFDGSSLENQIEQDKVSLYAANEELQRKGFTAEQKQFEADFAVKRAALELEKARIDAQISQSHLSEYDFQKNQLEYERKAVALAKAKEKLGQTKVENSVSIEKQKLSIQKLEQRITYSQGKLKGMSVYAQRSGPVLYANHPWNGDKVYVGMTAQPSWKIAEIPSMGGLFIEAWIHEVDYQFYKSGQKAKLSFDAYPGHEYQASLKALSTQPEERKSWGKDVYYKASFEFSIPEGIKLIPGMSAQLEVNNG